METDFRLDLRYYLQLLHTNRHSHTSTKSLMECLHRGVVSAWRSASDVMRWAKFICCVYLFVLLSISCLSERWSSSLLLSVSVCGFVSNDRHKMWCFCCMFMSLEHGHAQAHDRECEVLTVITGCYLPTSSASVWSVGLPCSIPSLILISG